MKSMCYLLLPLTRQIFIIFFIKTSDLQPNHRTQLFLNFSTFQDPRMPNKLQRQDTKQLNFREYVNLHQDVEDHAFRTKVPFVICRTLNIILRFLAVYGNKIWMGCFPERRSSFVLLLGRRWCWLLLLSWWGHLFKFWIAIRGFIGLFKFIHTTTVQTISFSKCNNNNVLDLRLRSI